MGEPGPGMSIDRIDVDGDYEPKNCRWSTVREQSLNKRETRFVIFEGKRWTVFELCEAKGLRYDRVLARLDRGWSPERAILGPKMLNGYRQAGK